MVDPSPKCCLFSENKLIGKAIKKGKSVLSSSQVLYFLLGRQLFPEFESKTESFFLLVTW